MVREEQEVVPADNMVQGAQEVAQARVLVNMVQEALAQVANMVREELAQEAVQAGNMVLALEVVPAGNTVQEALAQAAAQARAVVPVGNTVREA